MSEASSAILEVLAARGAAPGALRTRKTRLGDSEEYVLFAIDDQGLPMLVIPLSPEESDVNDRESRGIDLNTHAYVIDEGTEAVRCAFFRCIDAHASQQFAYMADDLMAHLQDDGHPTPGVACTFVLDRWRSLLEPRPSSLLSLNAQVGLIAELHLLEAILSRWPRFDIQRWSGPLHARHDFHGPSGFVEVKATLSRTGFPVAIHGWYQLETPESAALFLYAERLERVAEGGETIAVLVRRILDTVPSRSAFLEQLRHTGFELTDSPSYGAFAFSVLEHRCHEVTDEFPHLTRDSLAVPSHADMIAALEYSIDLGHLPPVETGVEAKEFAARLLGG